MIFHYAVQTCDSFSNIVRDRFTGTSKKEVTWKCVTSFFIAVDYAAKKNQETKHIIRVFDDRSSEETIEYLNKLKEKFQSENIEISIVKTKTPGLMESVRECYEWLREYGEQFVYQIQDDYLFTKTAVYEIIDIWFQMYNETKHHSMIVPYNDSWLWLVPYRNKPTPRTVIVGSGRYWIQCYEAGCSFFTSLENFIKHWKYLEKFLDLPAHGIVIDGKIQLESISINRIFDEGVLGLTPITTLAMHIQSELEKDPHIDWKEWWDEVELVC